MSASPKKPRGRPPRNDARFRDVARRIRQRILDGAYPTNEPLPSIRRLAADFDVGKNVIVDALEMLKQEHRVVPNGLRRLVVAAGKRACSTASGVVVQVISSNMTLQFQDPLGMELQRGIQLGVGELREPLLIFHDGQLRRAVPDDLLDRPIRGILLTGRFTRAVLRRYQQLDVPVVLCDFPAPAKHLHSVSVDNERAAFEATSRLIDLGHRRITFVRFVQLRISEVDPDSLQRQAGYQRAIRSRGLGDGDEHLYNATSYDGPESPWAKRIVAQGDLTAVVTADNQRARAIIDAARRLGRRVPEDFSVVGFQGSLPNMPELSGPRVDFADLGRQAALLCGQPRRPEQHLVVPATWFEGKTHGPAPRQAKR